MPFVVETGAGVADATAYITVAFADLYHANRNNADWAAVTTTGAKQAAIMRATDYIETFYGERFVGIRSTAEQGLAWPRVNCWDELGNAIEGVPLVIQKACAEYALRALSDDLAADSTTTSGGSIAEETKKVGDVTRTIKYATPLSVTSSSGLNQYPAADRLVKSLLVPRMAVRA